LSPETPGELLATLTEFRPILGEDRIQNASLQIAREIEQGNIGFISIFLDGQTRERRPWRSSAFFEHGASAYCQPSVIPLKQYVREGTEGRLGFD
jgi:hypothetical protein